MAANARFGAVSPYKVQLDDVAIWARRRGNQVLHLGGGRGAREDSLFEFKRRFSPRSHPFSTGRWILAPSGYEALVRAREAVVADRGVLDTDYHPAYRARVLAR